MIGDKTISYEGRNTDLNSLKDGIANYLQGDGFKVQVPKVIRRGVAHPGPKRRVPAGDYYG